MRRPFDFKKPLWVEAPCKINLFLDVLGPGRRADGFHEVATVLEAIDLADLLAITAADSLEVTTDRPDVPSGPENLAWRIVKEAEGWMSRPLPARIAIEKSLPPGSGLGAGSSDAAAALRGVLGLHRQDLPPELQRELAARIGSDVPFFVTGGLALGAGRGERIAGFHPARPRWYVVVLGAPPTSTKEVYAAVRPDAAPRDHRPLVAALQSGAPLDPSMLFNRLEAAAFERYPELAGFAARIESAAGRRPMLSGSGSAFFLLAEGPADAEALAERVRAGTDLDARAASSRKPWPGRIDIDDDESVVWAAGSRGLRRSLRPPGLQNRGGPDEPRAGG